MDNLTIAQVAAAVLTFAAGIVFWRGLDFVGPARTFVYVAFPIAVVASSRVLFDMDIKLTENGLPYSVGWIVAWVAMSQASREENEHANNAEEPDTTTPGV